jgi:two-component system heavy metal sensor histidine kinase CusS
MKRLPFRLKIALLSAAISGIVLVGFGASAWLMIVRQKLESVDTEIRSHGARHPGWIANRGNYQRLDDALNFIFGEAHQNQVILLVTDADGTVLHTSDGWPAEIHPDQLDCVLADDPNTVLLGGGPGAGRGRGGLGRGMGPGGGGSEVAFTKVPRFLTMNSGQGEWRLGMLGTAETTLVIGLNLEPARAELNRIRNAFLFAMPAALSLVGLGGWLIAGRALRPMKTISETAERVTASGLDQRIPASGEDPEITRVIQVLNRMMDRLEASFRQATRFSADASHELKTPLAIMQAELESALQAAVPGSSEQQTFSNLLEETQRLKTITRSLLLLAQADAGQLKLSREPVDLTDMLENILEDARILAEEQALQFEVQLAPRVIIQADPALLHTALLNLLTNAIKHNEPGGRVSLHLEDAGNHRVLDVGNSGPPIPTEEQSKIFDRFHRVEATRSRLVEGFGLGLGLAREIIRAHGGELTLVESGAGQTRFRAVL